MEPTPRQRGAAGGVTLGVSGDFAQFGLVVDEWSRPPQLLAALAHGTHNIPPPRTGDPLPVDNQVPLAFIHGRIRGSKLLTLDAAHLSNVEQADAFTSALMGFLGSL